MSKQETLIKIRTNSILHPYERLNIQINDQHSGEIGNNEELIIPVPAGSYVLTGNGFLGKKVYPLNLTMHENDQISITIEPVAGRSKFQFNVETKIPSEKHLNEFDLISKRLAWDMSREITLSKLNNSKIHFDLENISFPNPIHFELDIQEQSLKVYAGKNQDFVLYESSVHTIESLVYPFIMNENIIEHAFYRADGTLLGYLSLENGKWIVSSKWQDRIAEICLINTNKDSFNQKDHYLLSLQSEFGTLAFKKWGHNNILQFQNINIPDIEYNEILLLAFITFSALHWGKVVDYVPERIPFRLLDFITK